MPLRVLFIPALLAACAAAAQPHKNAPASQAGSPGGEIKDDQGKLVIRYAAIVPKELPPLPQKSLGLILGLHGLGGDEKQQLGPISQTLAACKLSRDYVILGLKSKGNGWAEADQEPLCKAIAWALKEYPVDPRRVYAWGYSSGAFGVGLFGTRHQDLLAAGIMQAGGVWGPPKKAGGDADVQLYLIHGEKDTTVPVKTAHDSCAALKAANYRFVYHELTGADHGLGGPGIAPLRQDAIRWIHALRNRATPLNEQERKLVEDLTAKLKDPKASPPQTALMRLQDLAGPDVDQALVLACQSERRELRLSAALLCQQRLYGKPVLEALAALLKDKDGQVRTAALRALGLAANWQYPEACEALVALANDATRPDGDRVSAAGQLGIAAPLQLYCVNRDALVFDTLKGLLEDKNAQLKTVARLGLDGKLLAEGQGFKVKP